MANRSTLRATRSTLRAARGIRSIPGVQVSSMARMAGENRVSGDFLDLIEAPDGTWDVVIGDVSGKGREAGAASRIARDAARVAIWTAGRPSTVLAAINERIRPLEQFCTACCVRLQVAAGGVLVTIAVGGHPLPLAVRGTGRVETLGRAGMLLGLFGRPSVSETQAWLAPGDTLVLYTDGLLDASGQHLDVSVLRPLLAECAERSIIDTMAAIDDWLRRSAPAALRDDVTVVALRLAPGAAPPSARRRRAGPPAALRRGPDPA